MTKQWTEKRIQRSDQPSVAMRLQLEHLYENGDLRNYTLVDESGLVISHAGSMDESNILAAYVPLMVQGSDEQRKEITDRLTTLLPGFAPENFIVRQFTLDDQQPVFLAIFGDTNAPNETELEIAITGLQRIIRTTSAFDQK